MKAAVLRTAPGTLAVEELTIEPPQPGEVLVRTAHAGLCHTDLGIVDGVHRGPLPAVLGHEAAGVVEATGAGVTYVRPGDHVVVCFSGFCGECRFCLTGRSHLCNRKPGLQRDHPALRDADGQAIGGLLGLAAFAEQMVVHERHLAKVRQDMPLDVAALLGCAVTTGIGAVVHTAKVQPGSSVAVVGCGGVGLAAVQGAAIAGAHPIVAVELSAQRRERALAIGATHAVDPATCDAVEAVRELTGGGVDHSFEAIGTKATAEQAFAMLSAGGIATVIGSIPSQDRIEVTAFELFNQEKRLQGSNLGSNRFRLDMPWFCDLYLGGRLHLDELLTARRPLQEINEGFDDMRSAVGVRTVVDFSL